MSGEEHKVLSALENCATNKAAYTQGLFDANEGNGEQEKASKCCGCGKEQEKASNARHGAGRKFWALLICLLSVFVCGIFEFDITMAVVGLYGLYVGGNVSQKVGVSVVEHGGVGKRHG